MVSRMFGQSNLYLTANNDNMFLYFITFVLINVIHVCNFNLTISDEIDIQKKIKIILNVHIQLKCICNKHLFDNPLISFSATHVSS